jgi:hypothetical protein
MKKIILFVFITSLLYVACTKDKYIYRNASIIDNIRLSFFRGEKRSATNAKVQFEWTDSVNNQWSYTIVDSANSLILFSDTTNVKESDTIGTVQLGRKYNVEIKGIRHINLSDTTRYKDNLKFKFFIGTMGDVQITAQ